MVSPQAVNCRRADDRMCTSQVVDLVPQQRKKAPMAPRSKGTMNQLMFRKNKKNHFCVHKVRFEF